MIEFCDRAAYLDRGRLVADGPCRDVLEQYANDVVLSERGMPVARVESKPADVALDDPAALPPTEILRVDVLDADGVPTQAFAYRDEVCIRVEVAFRDENRVPCFGIQLKSTDDIVLWTATTQLAGYPIEPMAAGTRTAFEWRLRANAGGGRYVVAIGVGDARDGEYRRHSRAHYAAHFDVLPEPRRGAGWLEPEAAFVQIDARVDDAPVTP